MNIKNRNRTLHKYWDACPWCYKHAYKRRGDLFYCRCGGVWKWDKKEQHPVLMSAPIDVSYARDRLTVIADNLVMLAEKIFPSYDGRKV